MRGLTLEEVIADLQPRTFWKRVYCNIVNLRNSVAMVGM